MSSSEPPGQGQCLTCTLEQKAWESKELPHYCKGVRVGEKMRREPRRKISEERAEKAKLSSVSFVHKPSVSFVSESLTVSSSRQTKAA